MDKRSKREKPLLSKLSSKLMSIDKYGETRHLSIAGSNHYPSVLGTLLTLIIFSVMIPFGFNKFIIMRDREDTNFQSTVKERAIDPYEVFTYEQIKVNPVFLFFDS